MNEDNELALQVRTKAMALQRACDDAVKAGLEVRLTTDIDWQQSKGGRRGMIRIGVGVSRPLRSGE